MPNIIFIKAYIRILTNSIQYSSPNSTTRSDFLKTARVRGKVTRCKKGGKNILTGDRSLIIFCVRHHLFTSISPSSDAAIGVSIVTHVLPYAVSINETRASTRVLLRFLGFVIEKLLYHTSRTPRFDL